MIVNALESRSLLSRLIAADGVVYGDFGAFRPFEDYNGPLNVALAGDVNDDGDEDVVIGAGAGGGPRVVVLDPRTGERFGDWFAFESSFRGGVTVAVDGEVNELLVGAGPGGGPVVVAYDIPTFREKVRTNLGNSESRTGITLDANSTSRTPLLSRGSGFPIYLDIRHLRSFEQSFIVNSVYDVFEPLGNILRVTNVRPDGYPSDFITANVIDLDFFPVAVDGIATNTLLNRQPSSFHSLDVYVDDNVPIDRLASVFVHEIGHVFGLKHANDPSNIMHAPAPIGGRFNTEQLTAIRMAVGRATWI